MSLRLKLTISLLLLLTGINLLLYAHTTYLGVYLGTMLMVVAVLLGLYDPKRQWHGVSVDSILRAALAVVPDPFRRFASNRAPLPVTPGSTQDMPPGMHIPPATILKLIISALLLLVGTNLMTHDSVAARVRMETSRRLKELTLVFVQREDPSAVDMVRTSLAKASFPKDAHNTSHFLLPGTFLLLVGLLLPFVRFRRAAPAVAQPAGSSS